MPFQRRSHVITPEAEEWVRSLACHTPRAFGYARETWAATLLARHVRGYCRAAGHPSLAGLTYAGLSRLLARNADPVAVVW